MQKLLSCVMDIGEQMLICGAEVHRVEDSIERMCKSFGAKRTDVFSITSSMLVTVSMENGEKFTQTRRIRGIGTDMERLHSLNELSRRICQETLSLEEMSNICSVERNAELSFSSGALRIVSRRPAPCIAKTRTRR